MSTTKISQKITGYKVVTAEVQSEEAQRQSQESAKIIQMHESVARPEMLAGSTYKIKTPMCEHAMYITVNDIILNEGTDHEQRRPFEVFIASKNMEHFQWVVALTRLISAVFRKGGDSTFLVEELKAVFDPKGGYFKKGGVFMPSLVAEIGHTIEDHMKRIGFITDHGLDEYQKAYIEEKKQELAAKQQDPEDSGGYPSNATLCNKCMTKAAIQMDGCMVCLSCGDSKCG
jgi:hypothetical protein